MANDINHHPEHEDKCGFFQWVEEMGKVSLPTPESSKYKCTNRTADKDYLNGTMNIGSEPERAIIRLTSVVPLI